MIRVALCGAPVFDGTDLTEALMTCAPLSADEEMQVSSFDSPTALIDACTDSSNEQPFDLVIARQSLPGITGLQVAAELRDLGLFDDGLRFVLCASDGSRAADASRQSVSGYLVEPVSPTALAQVITPILDDIVRLHKSSVVLKCREGLHRIPYEQISLVETTGRDQTIRRSNDRQLSVRCSSKALFSHLDEDDRFYKLGSSYILNLDYVEGISMRSGTVALLDGNAVIAPVRLRTELADAICAHAAAVV